jgi:hypothetical protein
MGIWSDIESLPICEKLHLEEPYRRILLIRIEDKTHWLVGPFKELTKVATDLRGSPDLCNKLSENLVRIGLRRDDKPPLGLKRQVAYGQDIRGADYGTNFTASRVDPVAEPFQANSPLSVNRLRDRKENVKTFWNTRTPESHHIVEFNHLKKLGVSKEKGEREIDYQGLPAMLLAAEFHQRYISSILKETHHWDRQVLNAKILAIYESLYRARSRLFIPLWELSQIILRAAQQIKT